MGMKQQAGRPLSTLLYNEDTGEQLIRVSIWVDPEALEIESEISDRESTIPVRVQKGRTTIYGKIDREAYKVYLTRDLPEAKPEVPMSTDNGQPRSRILSRL